MTVANIAARDAIPLGSRFDGLLVEVLAGVGGDRQFYIMGPGLGNADWLNWITSDVQIDRITFSGVDVSRIQTAGLVGGRTLQLRSQSDELDIRVDRLAQNAGRQVSGVPLGLPGGNGAHIVSITVPDGGEIVTVTPSGNTITWGGINVPSSSGVLTTGRILALYNAGPDPFTLVEEDLGATDVRRIVTGAGNVDVPVGASFFLFYAGSRWRLLNGQGLTLNARRYTVTFGPWETTLSAAADGIRYPGGYFSEIPTWCPVGLPPPTTGHHWECISGIWQQNNTVAGIPDTDFASLLLYDADGGGNSFPFPLQVRATPQGASGATAGTCLIQVPGANVFNSWIEATIESSTLNGGATSGQTFTLTFEERKT